MLPYSLCPKVDKGSGAIWGTNMEKPFHLYRNECMLNICFQNDIYCIVRLEV